MNKRLLSLLLVLPMVGSYIQANYYMNPYGKDLMYARETKQGSETAGPKSPWLQNHFIHLTNGETILIYDKNDTILDAVIVHKDMLYSTASLTRPIGYPVKLK